MQRLGKIVQCAPAVDANNVVFVLPAGLPHSGKLPVLSILCIICYRQRESIVTCEIVVIPMNSFIIQSLYLYI